MAKIFKVKRWYFTFLYPMWGVWYELMDKHRK